MKNNKFWNVPPKNPTQTMFRRFQKTPKADLFELPDITKDFKKRMKTRYSKFMEGI
jgi:hypothetical protein